MNRRRRIQDSSISFLDIICCGFGAIVLLLVIVPVGVPFALEESDQESGSVRDLQRQLFDIRGEVDFVQRELNAKQEQLDVQTERVAILRGELDAVGTQQQSMITQSQQNTVEYGELSLALQSLTDEMLRLRANGPRSDYIGGLTVDSEYIIFIVDTSGSMVSFAWARMIDEIETILDIYPNVLGMQIMNDMGQYMFTTYRGQWIPDTPTRRNILISQLRNWQPFSNSSPVEGITAAIRTFYEPDKKISLFVLGDDFTGNSIELVIDTVRQLNKLNTASEPLVKIHTIGFPVHFQAENAVSPSAIRFAALMRELASENMGTFVGLSDFR